MAHTASVSVIPRMTEEQYNDALDRHANYSSFADGGMYIVQRNDVDELWIYSHTNGHERINTEDRAFRWTYKPTTALAISDWADDSSQTITIGTGLDYTAAGGDRIEISYDHNNYWIAETTAYNSDTGSITFTITEGVSDSTDSFSIFTFDLYNPVVRNENVLSVKTVRANYDALANQTQFTPADQDIALVTGEQGTRYLPGSLGGTFRAAGLYIYNGSTDEWDYLSESLTEGIYEAVENQLAMQELSANNITVADGAMVYSLADEEIYFNVSGDSIDNVNSSSDFTNSSNWATISVGGGGGGGDATYVGPFVANMAYAVGDIIAENQQLWRLTSAVGANSASVFSDIPLASRTEILDGTDTAIGSTLSDIFTVDAGVLVADDWGGDRLYGWDDSANKATGFTASATRTFIGNASEDQSGLVSNSGSQTFAGSKNFTGNVSFTHVNNDNGPVKIISATDAVDFGDIKLEFDYHPDLGHDFDAGHLSAADLYLRSSWTGSANTRQIPQISARTGQWNNSSTFTDQFVLDYNAQSDGADLQGGAIRYQNRYTSGEEYDRWIFETRNNADPTTKFEIGPDTLTSSVQHNFSAPLILPAYNGSANYPTAGRGALIYDSSDDSLQLRNAANDAWVELGTGGGGGSDFDGLLTNQSLVLRNTTDTPNGELDDTRVRFQAENDNSSPENIDYAQFVLDVTDDSDGQEDGTLISRVISDGSNWDPITLSGGANRITIGDTSTDTIRFNGGSTFNHNLSVAGTLSITSDAQFDSDVTIGNSIITHVDSASTADEIDISDAVKRFGENTYAINTYEIGNFYDSVNPGTGNNPSNELAIWNSVWRANWEDFDGVSNDLVGGTSSEANSIMKQTSIQFIQENTGNTNALDTQRIGLEEHRYYGIRDSRISQDSNNPWRESVRVTESPRRFAVAYDSDNKDRIDTDDDYTTSKELANFEQGNNFVLTWSDIVFSGKALQDDDSIDFEADTTGTIVRTSYAWTAPNDETYYRVIGEDSDDFTEQIWDSRDSDNRTVIAIRK